MYKVLIYNGYDKKTVFIGFSNDLKDLNKHYQRIIKDIVYLMKKNNIKHKICKIGLIKIKIREINYNRSF
jgi:hypothetical protein